MKIFTHVKKNKPIDTKTDTKIDTPIDKFNEIFQG